MALTSRIRTRSARTSPIRRRAGRLVDDEQFLGVPQQQGSATLHLVAARVARGDGVHVRRYATTRSIRRPYTLTDAARRQELRAHRLYDLPRPTFSTAVSGPFTFYNAGVPYRGLYRARIRVFGQLPDRSVIHPAGGDPVYHDVARMNETMRAVRLHEIGGPQNLRVEQYPAAGAGRRRGAGARARRCIQPARRLHHAGALSGHRLPVTLGSDGAGELRARRSLRSARRRRGRDRSDARLGRRPARVGCQGQRCSRNAARRHVRGICRGAVGQRLSQAAVAFDGRSCGDSAWPGSPRTAPRSRARRVRAGETILITGVGGGVQTFVLLFARKIGARTIVTSSRRRETRARARRLGRTSHQLRDRSGLAQTAARRRADRRRRRFVRRRHARARRSTRFGPADGSRSTAAPTPTRPSRCFRSSGST